jgi:lipoate-protein ligase B
VSAITVKPLETIDCGLAEYRKTLDLQMKLQEQRRSDQIPDTVLIVEHPPVITLGARRTANRFVVNEELIRTKNIDIIRTRRGGGITAHNPGQIVFYPILNLFRLHLGITEYISRLETVGQTLLERIGVKSESRKGYPGLWAGGEKIASIGIRISKGISRHGMAININNDLSIFDLFVPCGLEGIKMTSVLKETGKEFSMADVKYKLAHILREEFCENEQRYTRSEMREAKIAGLA